MNVCLYSCLSYPTYRAHIFLRIIILPCVACLAVPFFFSHYLINSTIFGKKVLNIKFVLVFVTAFV